jgi:outer membrane lipase/esterase
MLDLKLIGAVRAAILGALLVPALAVAAAPPYSKMYVLGDSLSDTGNVKVVYDAIVAGVGGSPAPGLLGTQIPSEFYYHDGAGGATISNGPNYSQVLAGHLGLSAKASLLGGTNYSFGGARTDYQIFQFLAPSFLGLTQQRDRLLADHPGGLDGDALFVVFGGGNNVQDLLANSRSTGNTALGAPSSVAETVADIGGIVNDLYLNGANHVMLVNVPNVALVPRINGLSPAAVGAATFLSQSINAGIAGVVDAQQALGRNIIEFDVYSLLQDLVANPASYGLTNVTGRCFLGDDLGFLPGGTVCGNPDEYLFWDGIHPSARVHEILGNAMAVAAVPEPGTWAMLGVGLLVVVVARRRTAGC